MVMGARIPFPRFHPQGHYQQGVVGRGSWGHVVRSWQRGRPRPVGSCPHLRDIQQMLVFLPEEGQDDPFKVPATHMRQIPEGPGLIGVDKTKWTDYSKASAVQPEVELDCSWDAQACDAHCGQRCKGTWRNGQFLFLFVKVNASCM